MDVAKPEQLEATSKEGYRSIWYHLMRTHFRQGVIDAGGVKTRYAQAGPADAPTLVMLHGTAGSWETFCANFEALSQHFNCIAFDMIGCGFTEKPDKDYEIGVYAEHVGAVMDALGIRSASLLGVSLGSWIAVRFAVDHPERVDKMILISTAGLVSSAATMNRIKTQRSAAVDNPTWQTISGIIGNLVHDPKNRIDDMIALRQAVYRQPEMKRAMQHILVLQDPEIRQRNNIAEEYWRTIKAPTLIVVTPDSKDIYLEMSKRAAELIPNSRIAEIHNAGHWPHFEQADAFNRLAIEFLS